MIAQDVPPCFECGASFSWSAPSPVTGRIQLWYRQMELTARGPRCADRPSCRVRVAEQTPTLFE